MRKCFLILFPLFLSTAALANATFAKYEGCYNTLVFNGENVTSDGKNPGLSEIKSGQAFAVLDPVLGQTIPAVNLVIFQGFLPAQKMNSYDVVDAFSDLGTTTSNSSGDHFSFDGKLNYLPEPILSGTTHLKIDVTKVGLTQIFIHVVRIVDELPEMNEDNSYLLEKIDCP